MKIFVVNCGSSSIKYQVFEMADESVLARGVLERVGTDEARLTHVVGLRREQRHVAAPDHARGLEAVIEALTAGPATALDSVDVIDGVGHRVVHGGGEITGAVLINEKVIATIERFGELAPLHNPPNLAGIEAARRAIAGRPHVAVFDTAFLATLPPRAHRYAVPETWYRNHGVRRYGFHGTSHRYVTSRAAQLLGKDVAEVNLITAHLGNGCSMTAVAGGKAVDHSLGMSTLEGLMMGTRCGDLDPGIVLHMLDVGLTEDQVDAALTRESGLRGVSGVSNDMRDLLARAEAGHAGAALAIEMFVYRIVKYVGAYHAILPALDAVVLTGGIGENAVPVRRAICAGLARLGAVGDESRNATTIGGQAGPITTDASAVRVWVVPTNEELMIARDTAEIVRATAGEKKY